MKYGYARANFEELIRNYKVSNDKIIITFLDGSRKEIPFTEQNEAELLNEMLKQAKIMRMNKSEHVLKVEKYDALRGAIRMIPITFSDYVTANKSDTYQFVRTLSGVICGLAALTIVTSSFIYNLKANELNELKKYKMYLDMKEDIDKTDAYLFKGVKTKGMPLNINTLDNYSLNDIKQIRNNLSDSLIYSDIYGQVSSEVALTRKLCR